MQFRPRRLAALLPALLVPGALFLASCSSQTSEEDLDGLEETANLPDELVNPNPPVAAAPLVFSEACAAGDRLTLSAVGDVLLHMPLQLQAKSTDKDASNDDFGSLWSKSVPLFEKADISYANFEGPADESKAPSSYPAFNYNPTLMPALLKASFDVVSSANNHSLDKGSAGVLATLANFKKYGLPFTGTSEGGDVASHDWSTVIERRTASGKTMKVAYLACSYASNSVAGATNGIPDSKKQVLNCGRDRDFILKTIGTLAKANDAVVVTPHWGVEYELKARPEQKELAQAFIDAGALVVFGNHPHVPQPWEKVVSKKDGHEGFVLYSLGNFVSNQVEGVSSSTATWKSTVMYVGLTKKADGKTVVNGARYTPIYMQKTPIRTALPAESAAAGASGKATVSFTQTMYHAQNMTKADAPTVETAATLVNGVLTACK